MDILFFRPVQPDECEPLPAPYLESLYQDYRDTNPEDQRCHQQRLIALRQAELRMITDAIGQKMKEPLVPPLGERGEGV